MLVMKCRVPKYSSTASSVQSLCIFPRPLQEMKAEDGISVLGGESASETKLYNELDEPEAGGGEESDGVEGFFSEPDGEMELEPAASESEDGYSQHTASSSLQLHTTADSIPSSPASSLL